VNLKVDGHSERACLIKDIQYDPVHGDIVHVDFNAISMNKKLHINVPVIGNGEPIGVKQEGGSLAHVLWEIEVECLPADIPEKIQVDISGLKLGESIHVKDLQWSDKIKPLTDEGSVLFTVSAPVQAAAAEETDEGDAKAEPEVIKEKKEVPAEEGKGKEKEQKK
jgi:large subunit ribosomal protein L25